MIYTDVLIIGGGFAGVSAAQTLEKKGIATLLVDKKNYFEVTFATLRDITDPKYTDNKARKRYQQFLNGDFRQDSVKELTSDHALLESGEQISFKQAIIASGSRYPTLSAAKSHSAFDLDSRNNELLNYHQQLETAREILIIGGGIVGVELAGEIGYSFPDKSITLAHNSDTLLGGFKPKAQKKALEQLTTLGIKVQFNSRFERQGEQYIDLNSNEISSADVVLEALGTLPNSEFLLEHLADTLDEKNFVMVDQNLAVIGHDNLYALGDVASVGEAKLGYLAQQQGSYVAKSIIKKLSNRRIKQYKRNPLMALIPTGQKTGVVQLPFAVTTLQALVNMKQRDLFINKIYKAFSN